MPALIVIGWVGFVVVGVIALVASDSRLAVYAGLLMAVAFSALGIESLRRGEAQTGSLWLVLGWPE